ncbi:hypothetical protein [Allosphingosinicella sp.]|uniref:hypothetical protein n=1 Tax=Allosphingosinicella sp. TaxID=2823234 RepID=UPI0037833E60
MRADPQASPLNLDLTEDALVPSAAKQSSRGLGHDTARQAVAILQGKDAAYRAPTKAERNALLVGFAMRQKVLYGAAYDMVRLDRELDLTSPEAIASAIEAITLLEIKSTNRAAMKADLKGYFFNITAAELLTAQSLGDQYRFLFVNTLTGEHSEMGLNEVFGRARAMYPAWHIRF